VILLGYYSSFETWQLFEVVEELASLRSLRGTTGKYLVFSACETTKGLDLTWLKLKRVKALMLYPGS
jgi:hypothetical protein